MATRDFAKLFGHLEIPTLPEAAVRLLGMIDEPDVEIAEIARVIPSDPGISADFLRIVNSAHVGLPREVGDVRLAVGLLGVSRIRSLGLADSPVSATAGSSRLPDAGPVCCDELGLPAEAYEKLGATTDAACGELAELLGVRRPTPLPAVRE